nr:hypothetical protein [Tanacetum cinerariifolium]
MFDEYFNPPSIAVSPVPVAAAPRAVDLIDSPVSMSIDQDAPSTSIPSTQEQEHSLNIYQGTVDPTLFTWKAGNDLLLMSFFLGLQISQRHRGIFIKQSKYAYEIVKIYGMLTSDSVDIALVEKSKLDKDLYGKPVDATLYRGMIGSLMYLTSNADHAGCQDTRRSTSGSAQFLGDKLVSWSSKKQRALQSRVQRQNILPYLGGNGIVELYFVRMVYQSAGIFTKPLPIERFNFLIGKLGMRSMSLKMLKHLIEVEDE